MTKVQQQSTQLSWQELDEFLRRLSNASDLADCPKLIQEMVQLQVQRSEQEQRLSGRPLRVLVAEVLAHVWRTQVRPLLRYRNAHQWTVSLTPIAQYLDIFLSQNDLEEGGLPEHRVTRAEAANRLLDKEWVMNWVQDEKRALQVVECASELEQATSRTYTNWRQEGIKWLRTGLVQVFSSRTTGERAEYVLSLPDHYVERRGASKALKDKVLEAVREGGSVGLVGLAGIGKSTLLAGLVRDEEMRDLFGKRIAVVKVGKEDNSLRVLHRAAAALGEILPLGISGVSGAEQMLRRRLEGERVLVLVDDVHQPGVLGGVQRLGPQVVVVMATRAAHIAFAADVSGGRQVRLRGMESEEARRMAVKKAGREPENEKERAALQALVEMLEGHPLAVEVAAVGAASMGWVKALKAVKDKRTRLELLGYGQEQLNAWASLEAAWDEWMEEDLQEQLARLGRLPLLNWYDEGVGQAVWGVSAAGAHVVWGKMMHWQLVKRVGEGRYRMHGLVWDFVRKKAKELGMVSRLWAGAWMWRYPLRDVMPRWRWYRPSVPLHREAEQWAWWDIRMPGGTGGKKMMWLSDKVQTFWHSEESLHLLASPVEWVVVVRRKRLRKISGWLMGTGIAFLISGLVLTKIAQLPSTWEFWIPVFVALAGAVAAVLICLWLFFVVTVDMRRIVWWWTMGRSFVAEDSATEMTEYVR